MSTLRGIAAVTLTGYRARTGDTTTPEATVNAALDAAEAQIAEHLRRTVNGAPALASGSYQARLRIHPDGKVYPPAYPVTDPGTLTLWNTRALVGAVSDDTPFVGFFPLESPQYATVTWTGGYTASTLPTTLANAVYDLAHAIATNMTPVPVGATSVRLGDAAVTYAAPVATDLDTLVPGLTDRLNRYVNRYGG